MNKRALRKCAAACRRILREEAVRQAEAGDGPDGGSDQAEDIMTSLFLRTAMTDYLWKNGYAAPVDGQPGRSYSALRHAVSFLYEGDAPKVDRFFRRMTDASRESLSRLFGELDPSVWQEGPETVGWMHQYFMEAHKNEVYTRLKAGKKADKNDLPAITQLFTPSWIAAYMAENTIGRIWLDANPGSSCKSRWLYFVDKERILPDGDPISPRMQGIPLKPEDIKVLDPACGCGHLLVSAFDVLQSIYLEAGYNPVEVPGLILMHNLRGLDIDERAVEVARFTLLLKAARSNPAILEGGIELRLEAFAESDAASVEDVAFLLQAVNPTPQAFVEAAKLCEMYKNARLYGSLIQGETLEPGDWHRVLERLSTDASPVNDQPHLDDGVARSGADLPGGRRIHSLAAKLIKQTILLKDRYDAVITNPPYMGRRSMGEALSRFIDTFYPDGKNDLFAAFMERAIEFLKPGGYHAAINQHSWMFLSGYESLRVRLLETTAFHSMLHLGARAFEDISGEVVQTVSFILQNRLPEASDRAVFYRLADCPTPASKEAAFLKGAAGTVFTPAQNSFFLLPGAPIVYWASEASREAFRRFPPLGSRFAVKKGMDTGDNARYVRCWFEVDEQDSSFARSDRLHNDGNPRWFPYNKGGGSRRWYGSRLYVVDWEDEGRRIRNESKSNLRNERYFFRPAVTWSTVATGQIGFRMLGAGFLFDNGGSCLFPEEADMDLFAVLAFLNSGPAQTLLAQINPTINAQPGDVAKLPFPPEVPVHARLSELGRICVDIAKSDWDAAELSRDFDRHPLLNFIGKDGLLENAYRRWADSRKQTSVLLNACEEEIDGIVRSLVGLHGELSGAKPPTSATIAVPDLNADLRSFLSYAVSCLLGRLGHVLPQWDETLSNKGITGAILSISFIPDHPQDLVRRLRAFLAEIGGESAVEANLAWIASGIGHLPDMSNEVNVCAYFSDTFWPDHVKFYLHRPIYWLFSSGPEHAFQAIASYHHLTPETLETMRKKFVEPLLNSLASLGELTLKQERKVGELRKYASLLRQFAENWPGISKDDGVQANYAKFAPLLAGM